MSELARHPDVEPTAADMRLVIAASSAGTIFEWYDFFIYGTLASIIGKSFFPAGNATLQVLLVWAGFAVGFGFRPLGAMLFGYLGDRLGRKYTFLITVALMGVATAGVGLTPPAAQIGIAAPIIVIGLRVLQGLALGGEYGGAAIYVAEHAPAGRRGFYTGFIQASVIGGFVFSLMVVLVCKTLLGPAVWAAWGWRVPFVLSLLLLAISLYMRLKLSESPVFAAMRAEGELAGNPFVESFTYPGNKKRLFVAFLGLAAGMTVISYTAMFSALSFLKGAMRLEDTHAEVLEGLAAGVGMVLFVAVGHWSDKVGRKRPMVVGYVLTLALLFPLFWMVGGAANPGLADAARRAPVMVVGPDCSYAPFASEQPTHCGKLLGDLAGVGVPYHLAAAPMLAVSAGGKPLDLGAYPWGDKAGRAKALQTMLAPSGYNFAHVTPGFVRDLVIVLGLIGIMGLSALTYGPMAAQLTEMFPARIRYSLMSIPYHFGTGYFGGFLPLIASYIIARTGDPYAGLWYTWGVVALGLVVTLWGLKGGAHSDYAEEIS